MKIGALDRRLLIEQPTFTPDTYGEGIVSWGTLATVWGSATPLQGRELFDAQRTDAQAEMRFTVRRRTDLTPKMRVVFDSKNWGIVAISEVGRGEATEILAKAIDI